MQKCANPACEYLANPDPQISIGFCCEKCEGRYNGEDWAMSGKKRHTAYCTSKSDDLSFDSYGSGGGYVCAGWGGPGSGWGTSRKCAHPECNYMKHSDPSISQNYCCEKCEGLHQGADWAEGGKRHYKNCEKIEIGGAEAAWGGADAWGAPPPMYGMKGKGAYGMGAYGMGAYGKGAYGGYDPYGMWGMPPMQDMWGSPQAKGGLYGGGCKGKGKAVGGKAAASKAKEAGPSLSDHPLDNKVFIMGLSPETLLEDINSHFSLAGAVQFAALMGPGTAGVAFADPTEAEAAILHLNGTEIGVLNPQVITVSKWSEMHDWQLVQSQS